MIFCWNGRDQLCWLRPFCLEVRVEPRDQVAGLKFFFRVCQQV
jgi:hypothetical protein